LGFAHLSTGDLLRKAVADGTELGREAKGYMDSGKLVPDAVVIGMIRERLESGAAQHFLLDGFPRTLPQAEALDSTLAELASPVEVVLSLEVSRPELIRRLAGRWLCRRCGNAYHEVSNPYVGGRPCEAGGGDCDLYQRPDDMPETVAARLDVYDNDTAPLLDYYGAKGVVSTIDGEQALEAVYEQILKALP
jgi:adenylate kinase